MKLYIVQLSHPKGTFALVVADNDQDAMDRAVPDKMEAKRINLVAKVEGEYTIPDHPGLIGSFAVP